MKSKLFTSNFFILALIFLGLLSFTGGVVYLVFKLNYFGVIFSFILSLFLLLLIIRYLSPNKQVEIKKNIGSETYSRWFLLAPVLYLIFFGLALGLLFKVQTTIAIVSPWDVVSSKFFYCYGAATLFLLLLIKFKNKLSGLFISAHYFLTFSVALIVYKIGFGYDPFIHLASLRVIDNLGFIAPKTFYYVGQYALEISLHKLFFIPLDFLNLILVPVLAALTLPTAIYLACCDRFADKTMARVLPILLLVLPTSIFIMTVPQNLAYLFLLLTVILSFGVVDRLKITAMMILSLAALLIQPIAGLPAFFFASYILVQHLNIPEILKTLKRPSIIIANIVAIPLLLVFFAGAHFSFSRSNFNLLNFSLAGNENFILNFIYFFAFNKALIFGSAFLFATFVAFKNKALRFYWYFLASSFLAYLISLNLSFSALAASEQGDYPARILIVALIFSVPLLLEFCKEIIIRFTVQTKMTKVILGLFLIILICTSLYLSYPRQDRYSNSHGYSVSMADLDAAKLIATESPQSDYVVLANQQVGVAAINLYGLKKYYHDDIFYYSTQTGSPLYQYYLQMVTAPSRATMLSAMDYVGVNEMYFVLDKYWWAAPKILAEAKLSANQFWEIDGGEVYVFKYLK
ncbi:MAG: hypothetical protein WCK37_01230 [Candidatus Falkowbacteria bacterium]